MVLRSTTSQTFALNSFNHTLIHTCVWVQIPTTDIYTAFHINNFETKLPLEEERYIGYISQYTRHLTFPPPGWGCNLHWYP